MWRKRIVEPNMLEINRIYCMDNVAGMKLLDDESVDLAVTSPPYNKIRKYRGFSWDLDGVVNELFRVTKIGGVVVWVVADQVIKGSETLDSFRHALAFRDVGFNAHDTMIYLKEHPIPQVLSERYTNAFEYMFVFSKGKPKCNYLRVPTKSSGRVDNNYRGQMTSSERYVGREKKTIKDTKIKTNVWTYSQNNGIDRTINHPAQFPEQLAEDHIISWSNKGDLVLDPFSGSGTTNKVAQRLGRNHIGFEISQEYVDLANERLSASFIPPTNRR
jgi:DNA modification methylase